MALVVETHPARDVCTGSQAFVTPTLTAGATLSAPANTRYCLLTVENNSIRYRSDGVAPTITTGVLMASGQARIMALANLSNVKLQDAGVSASVYVEYYGDPLA